jgi:signal transduction histidine kinase
MQALKGFNTARRTRREILALLLASLSCVVVLKLSLADRPAPQMAGFNLQMLLIIALVAGAGGGGAGLVIILTLRARAIMRQAREETAKLKRNLRTAEAVFRAEPQVLIYWEHGDELKIITHTLTSVKGVPQDQPTFLRFGSWLDPHAAQDLKEALDLLFAEGHPFTLFLKTNAGGHLEADGRATGSRAVLRLRDVAGAKQDFVRMLEQHRRLTREIRVYRALLNALPVAVWLKNQAGEIKWTNQAYAKAVDAQTVEEVQKRQLELLESRQRTNLERTLQHAREFANRMLLVVGGERRAHDVFAVESDEFTAGAAIDVADLMTAQGELDRQVAAYDRTLDRVATPVAIFGRNQELTFYNEAYQNLWRLDPGWLDRGPTDSEILDRLKEASMLPAMADYRKWKAQFLSCYHGNIEHEDWWPLSDGRTLHVLAAPRSDGGVTYIFEDMSERLALESRYNALIHVQHETIDSLKEGVAVFATNGRLQLFNKAFLKIWQLSHGRMEQGPHIDDVISLASALFDKAEVWQSLKEVVTSINYQRESASGQIVRPDGSVIDFATTPLPDGGTLVTFADVTASRAYERALVERNEALEAADRLKSQFIGHVSYELRTPLTNIIGFNELLKSPHVGPLNDKQHEYLDDISISSQTLLSIIDDILDLATIDAGTLELDLKPVAIRPLIDSAVQHVQERALRGEITLEVAIADDIDTIVADEDRVRQVLHNILSNAIGFSNPHGVVRLTCWREGPEIMFAIEDNGVGIPKEQQHKIFDRFESNSQGSGHRGAGLGLSIVKSLVDLHGGQMGLMSEPGHGTTITVRLPIAGQTQTGETDDALVSESA